MPEYYRGFAFRYCYDVDNPGKIRIYIESQPSYRGRDTDCHSTHRLYSGGGAPPHICLKPEAMPSTYEEAEELAHRWARATENYIRTGRFE
ncbi:MAG TPA: hypothetical protein VGX48_25165 [Pyrinomonadaceae bacterium]|jgi:hypothetical protein|nr:hypothetical protein [Pyrinomonadaceae bacterium]